jgi:hypothetical protein
LQTGETGKRSQFAAYCFAAHRKIERARYQQAKQSALLGADNVAQYNQRKQQVILDIYARAFKAAGLL